MNLARMSSKQFHRLVRFLGILVFVVGIADGAIVVGSGCNYGQVQTAFTIAEDACIAAGLAEAFIPAGTLASVVATDIQVGCNIATSYLPQLQALVEAFLGYKADAGTLAPAASGPYHPAPFIATVLAAKRAQ
jgi:hypothetical protein